MGCLRVGTVFRVAKHGGHHAVELRYSLLVHPELLGQRLGVSGHRHVANDVGPFVAGRLGLQAFLIEICQLCYGTTVCEGEVLESNKT